MNQPYGIVIDRSGNIYVADRLNGRVRRIDGGSGVITTLAGDGSGKFSGDGGPSDRAGLAEPNGLALDRDHRRLFIADVADHRVRVIDLATGVITTFAGTGNGRHAGDGGPAASADVFGARAVALAPDDSLYVLERQGSSLRRVRDGIIETVAGTGARGYAGDDHDARHAVFNAPKEMAVDRAGNVFIVDTENHVIRLIDAQTWIVTTIAGTGKAARRRWRAWHAARPHGAVVGPDGAVYIGDSENHRVRKLVRRANRRFASQQASVRIRNIRGNDASPVSSAMLCGLFAAGATASACDNPRQMDGFKTCADVAKAEQEGALVVYSTDPEAAAEQELAKFRALFPKIKTTYLRIQAGGLYAKLLAERQGNAYLADVAQLSDMSFALDFQKRGGYMQYVSPEMAAYKTEYKSSPEGYWTWGALVIAAIAYNPKLVSADEAPRTWQDTLDPKWTDAISVKVSISGLQHVEWYVLRQLYGNDFWPTARRR